MSTSSAASTITASPIMVAIATPLAPAAPRKRPCPGEPLTELRYANNVTPVAVRVLQQRFTADLDRCVKGRSQEYAKLYKTMVENEDQIKLNFIKAIERQLQHNKETRDKLTAPEAIRAHAELQEKALAQRFCVFARSLTDTTRHHYGVLAESKISAGEAYQQLSAVYLNEQHKELGAALSSSEKRKP